MWDRKQTCDWLKSKIESESKETGGYEALQRDIGAQVPQASNVLQALLSAQGNEVQVLKRLYDGLKCSTGEIPNFGTEEIYVGGIRRGY